MLEMPFPEIIWIFLWHNAAPFSDKLDGYGFESDHPVPSIHLEFKDLS